VVQRTVAIRWWCGKGYLQPLTTNVGLLCQSVRAAHPGYLSAFKVKNLRLLVEKIQSLMLMGVLPSQETIKLN